LRYLLFQKFGIIVDLTINLFVIILFFSLELRYYYRLCSACSLNVYWNNVFNFKNVNIIEAIVLIADLALTVLDSDLICLNYVFAYCNTITIISNVSKLNENYFFLEA